MPKKHMLSAGKMKGKISMKTRAVELMQEAAEHLKDARKYLIEWGEVNSTGLFGANLSEISDKIDEINESLIDMVGDLCGLKELREKALKEEDDEEGDEDEEENNEDDDSEENDDEEE